MTAKEASFHVVKEGLRAGAEASSQGGSPDAIDALMGGGEFQVSETVSLKPFNLLVGIAMKKLNSPFMLEPKEDGPSFVGDEMELATTALCFIDPRKTHDLIRRKKLDDLEAWALDVAALLSTAVMKEMIIWINREMNRQIVEGEPAAEPGKQDQPAATPAAAASPSLPATPPLADGSSSA